MRSFLQPEGDELSTCQLEIDIISDFLCDDYFSISGPRHIHYVQLLWSQVITLFTATLKVAFLVILEASYQYHATKKLDRTPVTSDEFDESGSRL